MTTTAQTTPSSNLLDNGMILSVSFTLPGNRRKLPKTLVHIHAGDETKQADKKRVHATKDLLASPELEAVKSLDGEIRRYVADLTLPGQRLLGKGKYLVANTAVVPIDQRLTAYHAQRLSLIDAVLAAYDSRIEEAKGFLGPAFDPTDYPNPERYRAAFGMDWSFMTFGVANNLERINADLFAREQAKFAQRLQGGADSILGVLIQSMRDLTDHMVERLTPGRNGATKTFHKTLVTNMTDFLTNFRARTGDLFNGTAEYDQLGQIIDQAKEVMKGVNVDTLKQNSNIRTYVADNMAKVKSALDAMVVTSTRAIDLDDDDEEDAA